ncbi:hypothetical protein BPAE_0078g00280 [Botrytis paeoniae]|uniref:Uncharacterized protein n=1 Tax=Botrytis paeoniae TaxID=278948 RepID=A0A4Z1FRB9_9HELO|nr:hypothetical protein BPAE_0078g00280 [Botrytis paeoniae]
MITLDVAAALAALEAKVITDLRDEIANDMASANGDINAQSKEFSKLFNARRPAENPDEFLQQFVKFSFGKAPSNVSQDNGKGKTNDEAAIPTNSATNEHATLRVVQHAADDTIKVEDGDVIASGPPHSSPSANLSSLSFASETFLREAFNEVQQLAANHVAKKPSLHLQSNTAIPEARRQTESRPVP